MAGTEVGSLYYDLGVDDKALNEGLDNADKSVKGFGATLGKFGDNVQAGFRDVAKVLAVSGAALTLYAKNATDFTVDFVKSSKSLGVQIGTTTTEASRLVAAFGRMGIEASDASAMFGIFSKNIVASTTASKDNVLAVQKLQIQIEATKKSISDTSVEIQKNGDKSGDLTLKLKALQNQLSTQQNELTKTADSFAKLGVSTVDATGKQKDFNTLLFEVADKFKGMPDGVDKTTIALDLFGRSGKDMIKVLNLGSDGIQDLEKKADELGLTLNAKTIGAVNGLVQSQKNLKEQTDAMKIAVGTATAPVLTKFNEKLVEITQSLLNAGEPIKSVTTNVLAFGGPVASGGAAVAGFLGNISSITPKIAAMAARLGLAGLVIAAVAGAIVILQVKFHAFDNILEDTKNFLFQVKAAFDWMTQGANSATQPVGWLGSAFNALNNVIIVLTQYWQQVLWPALQAVWAAIVQNLLPALGQLWDSIVRLWNALQPALIDALKILGVLLAGALLAAIWAFVAALNIVIQVISVVVSVISNLINWISNLISWFGNLVGVVVNTVKTIIIIFQNLPKAFGDVVATLWAIAGGIAGGILKAVGNLGNTLYQAGKDLINGMINGITDKFKELTGKVKDAVGSAVSSVKNFLGIHSPSTVFADIGRNVTAGFVKGINDTSQLAVDAMGTLGNNIIAPAMNINSSGVSGGSASNTPASVVNQFSGDIHLGDAGAVDEFFDKLNRNTYLESIGVSPL